MVNDLFHPVANYGTAEPVKQLLLDADDGGLAEIGGGFHRSVSGSANPCRQRQRHSTRMPTRRMAGASACLNPATPP